MKLPRAGDVIHYRYLWRHEANSKLEDGRKTRPCLVVAARESEAGLLVYTVPISTKNHDPAHSRMVPADVCDLLKLSRDSRVVWNELNRFIWVGPDVEPLASGTPYYGNVGFHFWDEMRRKVLGAAVRPIKRTE